MQKNTVLENLHVLCLDAAQALGLPFLSPYLQSIGSDYKHGVNFATSASPVLQPNTSLFATGVSPFYLAVQINQMKQFKARVEEFKSQGFILKLEPKNDRIFLHTTDPNLCS